MKRIILAVAVSALAIMSVASAASASTPSHTPPAPITKQLEADTHYNGVTYAPQVHDHDEPVRWLHRRRQRRLDDRAR